MKNAVTNMPVKRDGKLLLTGSPIELDQDEFDILEAEGVVSEGAASEDEQVSLEDRIKTLVAEGFEFEGLNMQKTKAALGKGFDHVKRAEVDAILTTAITPTT